VKAYVHDGDDLSQEGCSKKLTVNEMHTSL